MTTPHRHEFAAGLTVAITPAILYGGTLRKTATAARTAGAAGGPGDRHAQFDELLAALDELLVTPEQRTQIVAVVSRALPRLDLLAARLSQSRHALRAAAPTDPGYAALVADDEANELERVRISSELRTRIDGILTPAQAARVPAVLAADRAARVARLDGARAGRAHS